MNFPLYILLRDLLVCVIICHCDKWLLQQSMLKVLCCLQKAKLYVKAKKYEFHSESVEYLEYTLFPSGLIMADDKIKIIQDWPESRKVKDIWSFFEFTNIYLQILKYCHSAHQEEHFLEF